MGSPGDEGSCCGPSRRDARLAEYLAGLDRGEIVAGRILQVCGEGAVRVSLGPGVLTARAVGGRPEVGQCRLEVLVPGPRPILRLAVPGRRGGIEMVVDASREKCAGGAGNRLDRRA